MRPRRMPEVPGWRSVSEEWVVRIEGMPGVGVVGAPLSYYSKTGWQSDITHAITYASKEEAERVAFSIVTTTPSYVGYVSVEERRS